MFAFTVFFVATGNATPFPRVIAAGVRALLRRGLSASCVSIGFRGSAILVSIVS